MAWPKVATGVDWFVAIGDERARQGMREFAESGVVAGETGAASLGALAALTQDASTLPFREAGVLRPDATILLIVTEGATDRGNYKAVVGRAPEEVGTILTLAR